MKKFIFLVIALTSILWAVQYTCPMHPHILSEHEDNCPICGMDLVELKIESASKTDDSQRSSVTISASTVQNIGIITEKPSYSFFGREIKAYGSVAVNERKVSAISVRVEGWVEKLHVNALGDTVKKDDLLFTLYSPELLHAQKDYINALNSPYNERRVLAKNRLISLGISKQTIRLIKKTKKILEYVPFHAPSDGVISALEISAGSYLKPGMRVMNITDYSSVWVKASVNEQDAVYLDQNTKAKIIQRGLGNITYEVNIDYIYPEIDKKTRTVPVRLVLENNRGILRPGNYVEVVFESDYDRRLSVPSDALLHHSEGSYVIIAQGGGKFTPRLVRTGFRSKGRVAINSGLDETDSIVTSGQFLLDSESALRDSITNMREGANHDHSHH